MCREVLEMRHANSSDGSDTSVNPMFVQVPQDLRNKEPAINLRLSHTVFVSMLRAKIATLVPDTEISKVRVFAHFFSWAAAQQILSRGSQYFIIIHWSRSRLLSQQQESVGSTFTCWLIIAKPRLFPHQHVSTCTTALIIVRSEVLQNGTLSIYYVP